MQLSRNIFLPKIVFVFIALNEEQNFLNLKFQHCTEVPECHCEPISMIVVFELKENPDTASNKPLSLFFENKTWCY